MGDRLEVSEFLTSGPAEALAGLLGVPVPDIAGHGLPLLWHGVYLLSRPGQADLGPDGHPAVGGIPAPPGPGRLRMFAGGRVRSLAPLRCGRPATRRARVLRQVEKKGRTGLMTFVTVKVDIVQDGRTAVVEEQDVVYRDMGASPVRSAEAPESGAEQFEGLPGDWELRIDPVLLFRFSALTYNAHRIHYDRDYARGVEGYPGLVVHGPLQALVMAEAARMRVPEGQRAETNAFEYRLVSPLFDHQGLLARVSGSGHELTTEVLDHCGRRSARGLFRIRG